MRLLDALMSGCNVGCMSHVFGAFQSIVLAWEHLVVLGWWLLVTGYAVLTSNWLLGCPRVFWLLFKPH